MIQTLSQVKVADNTGVKLVNVIQILGQVKGRSFQPHGRVGDIVSCSVRRCLPNSQYKKGEVIHAVIVRTKKEIKRKDGSHIRFDENAVAIINKATLDPRGTRIFGPVARELRDLKFNKLVSLAPEVL